MSSIGSASVSAGMELIGAQLAKQAQVQQGKTVMQLLDSVASVAPGQTDTAKAPSAVGNLGQNINVRV